jgi:hypothetical protein
VAAHKLDFKMLKRINDAEDVVRIRGTPLYSGSSIGPVYDIH